MLLAVSQNKEYHCIIQISIIRLDKSAFVLNNGQIPLTKSRYLKYITNEEHQLVKMQLSLLCVILVIM